MRMQHSYFYRGSRIVRPNNRYIVAKDLPLFFARSPSSSSSSSSSSPSSSSSCALFSNTKPHHPARNTNSPYYHDVVSHPSASALTSPSTSTTNGMNNRIASTTIPLRNNVNYWHPNSSSIGNCRMEKNFRFHSMTTTTLHGRLFSSATTTTTTTTTEEEEGPTSTTTTTARGKNTRGRRVWKARQRNEISNNSDEMVYDNNDSYYHAYDDQDDDDDGDDDHWDTAVDDVNDRRIVDESLARICEQQEREGGRMKQSQLGVLTEDPHKDMRMLLENYTAAALASALRDREDVLQHCATLLAQNQIVQLTKILRPYQQKYILQRRHTPEKMLDFRNGQGFDTHNVELLRKGLNRMPRRVSTAHSKRAGVVLPLCNVDGVPCILFEKRSAHLRAHPDEVCLPGGMVTAGEDKTIVQTCLREMEEEIGIGHNSTSVLGVLRCNWGEVHHLVGVAVTPVVCFLGEIGESQFNPNPDEVAECFTVPLESFLDRDRWVHKKHYAPFFTGGPHIIWGLTGYIVNRFIMDIVERYDVVFCDDK